MTEGRTYRLFDVGLAIKHWVYDSLPEDIKRWLGSAHETRVGPQGRLFLWESYAILPEDNPRAKQLTLLLEKHLRDNLGSGIWESYSLVGVHLRTYNGPLILQRGHWDSPWGLGVDEHGQFWWKEARSEEGSTEAA